MAKHVRNNHITRQDLMEREATLLLSLAAQVEQLRYSLNVTMLNYTLSSWRWSEWGVLLASLQHQMEARSVSLSCRATIDGQATPTMGTSASRTSTTYSTKCGGKND